MDGTQTTPDDGAALLVRDRELAWRAAVGRGVVGPAAGVAGLLDAAGIIRSAQRLREAFEVPGVPVTHTFAVKAATLVPVLRLLHGAGVGAEVASPGELALARAAGVPAALTVLDSPAKTPAELREALALGIAVNADSPGELDRLDAAVGAGPPPASPLGLRVNPQLGAGGIAAMSTATATAKFGVPLRDPGGEAWVVRAFTERPWLTRLHCHTGSQGVPLELMAEGVRVAYALAERINAAVGRQQVDTVDIGGGLPVDFGADREPGFAEYARLLRERVPPLFDGRYRIVTEFGRSLLAKNGSVLARVEYAKEAGGRRIAVTHAGAQVAARTVFAPADWPLRVVALGPDGRPKDGPPVPQDVAGPCCFTGDVVAHARPLPLLEPGDLVALLDTGAYIFSTPFAYNALPRPGVHGYTVSPDGRAVRLATVRPQQTIAELAAECGAGTADALSGLTEREGTAPGAG